MLFVVIAAAANGGGGGTGAVLLCMQNIKDNKGHGYLSLYRVEEKIKENVPIRDLN